MKIKLKLLCLFMLPTPLFAADFKLENPDGGDEVRLEVITGSQAVNLQVNFEDHIIEPNSKRVFDDAKYIRNIDTMDVNNYIEIEDENTEVQIEYGFDFITYGKGRHLIKNEPAILYNGKRLTYMDVYAVNHFPVVDPKADYGHACLVGMVEIEHANFSGENPWKVEILQGDYKELTLVGKFKIIDPKVREPNAYDPNHYFSSSPLYPKPAVLDPNEAPNAWYMPPFQDCYMPMIHLKMLGFNYKKAADSEYPTNKFSATYNEKIDFIYQMKMPENQNVTKFIFQPTDKNWGALRSDKIEMEIVNAYCK